MLLILRPIEKSEQTLTAFTNAGIKAVVMSLQRNITLNEPFQSLLKSLASTPSAICVVTSTFAARMLADAAPVLAHDVRFLAVGQATAAILHSLPVPVDVAEPENSDGIITYLDTVPSPKTVILIKGEGGRGLIEQALSELPMASKIFSIYRRESLNPPSMSSDWSPGLIQGLIATSGEQLSLVFEHFDPNWLRQLPTIVVSQRLADLASTLGINSIHVADGARDNQLISSARSLME